MPKNFTRRNFLQAAAVAGAATVWTPELHAETLVQKGVIGMSKWELDTPALCVDMAKLEKNIAQVKSTLAGTGVGFRPHAKTHKTPAIAKLQLAAGAVGICTAKVSEAEAMFANGIRKILMTTANVTPAKVQRAMAISKKNPEFIQAVDNMENAQALSDAARALKITVPVVVDVSIGGRSGVPPGDQALAIAQMVSKLPNLKLMGMLAYDGGVQHAKGFKTRSERALKTYEPIVETYNKMKASGLNMEIFSGGGTGTYNIMPKVPGFTDVQVGSYIFMDCQYMDIGGATNDAVYDDFAPSLTVMTTVLNNYFPGRLTADAGAKALTLNVPAPRVIGEPDFIYSAGSDEFGGIRYTKANKTYKVGDKLELIVPHCDPAVNEYDLMYAIRNDKVEAVWPIAARGKSQ
jgi:D-serine deaminase-like pyridoxal phosphate-dependent protein